MNLLFQLIFVNLILNDLEGGSKESTQKEKWKNFLYFNQKDHISMSEGK
jgi:hypothetical protein